MKPILINLMVKYDIEKKSQLEKKARINRVNWSNPLTESWVWNNPIRCKLKKKYEV